MCALISQLPSPHHVDWGAGMRISGALTSYDALDSGEQRPVVFPRPLWSAVPE